MKARVTKLFEFEASHSLPNHLGPDGKPGKCSRNHGHSYKLEVTLYDKIWHQYDSTSHGFVMDFYTVGQIVKKVIIDKYDHQDLNRLLPFRTTAELMTFYFLGELLEAGLPVEQIRLWETRTGSAIAHIDDFDLDQFNRLRQTGDWMEWTG
jgi:6-pyruvoyltetrahydropterin/6-carboxytetrahydropterin synthase